MKFNCGPTRREKIDAKERWHRWFAWYPVRIGSHDCRWLETVWRKGHNHGVDHYWTWKYAVVRPTGE